MLQNTARGVSGYASEAQDHPSPFSKWLQLGTRWSLTPKLFTPLTLGGKKNPIELLHRVVMAPLTRLRAGDEGVQPSYAATYYSQRATAGGLTARGYFGAPGIFNKDQVQAWRQVTDAVHAKQGKIFLQLWHTGRISHPLNQPDGQLPVSSSAIPASDTVKKVTTRDGRKEFVTPRALEIHEIPLIVQEYRHATENAFQAGFDGVELHSANGYLLEQFLCDAINSRTDQYGGSIENRTRILFETLEAILQVTESSRVGIRLSPFGKPFGSADSDPGKLYEYILRKLNDYDLAYVHLIEPRGYHAAAPHVPPQGVTKFYRSTYKGVLLTSSGYDRASGVEIVESGLAELVAYGRHFISNPDLVARLQHDAPLADFEVATFYSDGEKGYTDYPALEN